MLYDIDEKKVHKRLPHHFSRLLASQSRQIHAFYWVISCRL